MRINYGYADITQYSRYPHEQEILFNPLNSFTNEKCIHQFIKGKGGSNKKKVVKTVHLKYGALA